MKSWYESTVKDDSVNAAARKSGIVQTTLSRQVKARNFTAETVIAISRAYGVGVIRSLVQTGHLTNSDVEAYRVHGGLDAANDREIAAEVMKRLAHGSEF